jgi:hypothetical protein
VTIEEKTGACQAEMYFTFAPVAYLTLPGDIVLDKGCLSNSISWLQKGDGRIAQIGEMKALRGGS